VKYFLGAIDAYLKEYKETIPGSMRGYISGVISFETRDVHAGFVVTM
jgi:hypothetical protein